MAMISGGQLLAKALKAEGVSHIFTLCGGHISPTYDGALKEGIRVIDFRHEQAATHAAEGWAKVTGQPGVSVVTAGPGVTDAVTALTNAFQAPSPMLLIGGRSPLREFELGSLQEMDHVELLRPITKWGRTVFSTARIPEYVSMAFRHALADQPGPVFLELPSDVFGGEVDEESVVFPTQYRTTAKTYGDPDLVAEAARLLNGARHPMMLAGSTIWWSRAWDELRQLVATVNSPIYLNAMGRGSIPPDDPHFFAASRRFALNNADAIVIIGTPFDFRLAYGRAPLFNPEAKVIQIDTTGAEIGRNRSVDVGIVGDTKAILQQLLEKVVDGRRNADKLAWLDEVRAIEVEAKADDEEAMNSDAVPIHQLRLCRELRDFIDHDATVIGDGGDIVTFAAGTLRIYEPGHWLDPGRFGCLGVGTGYAIAAKLARPNEQVVIVNGDGSFGLNGMEFDTMARHNLAIVSVIGNDGCWGQVKHGQVSRYGTALGTELARGIRYDKMVEALGGHGEFVERPEDIRPALERAFASGLPACVNVVTDPTVAYGRGRRSTGGRRTS